MIRLTTDDVLVATPGALSEGPRWDHRTMALVWVDILAGTVHRIDPTSGRRRSWDLGMPVGAVAPCAAGGWVAAVERGFAFFDEAWSAVGPVLPAPDQRPGTRFNDGACDPAGRFWAGTLGYDGATGVGALYRMSAGGPAELVLSGVTTSNGIDWSLDGHTMYYVDSGAGTVDSMTFDPTTGIPTERHTLIAVPPEDGVPDGLTVDSDGYLWVAIWGGGCIRRYAPSGSLERTVRLPVTQVTSMCFGGLDYDELFITTAYDGLTDAARAEQPLAGAVFRHRPEGIRGRPPRTFAGDVAATGRKDAR